MLLREIPFRLSYCTGGDDLVGGFLVPRLVAAESSLVGLELRVRLISA